MTLHTQERPSVIPFSQNDNRRLSVPPLPLGTDVDDDEIAIEGWHAVVISFAVVIAGIAIVCWVCFLAAALLPAAALKP